MMPANSNCGGANHCNATGQCIGCTVAADCPGTDTACRTRTCTAGGVCGFIVHAPRAPSWSTRPRATARACSATATATRRSSTTTPTCPVDGNVCTTDECSSGTPSHRPVASGTTCGGSLVCDGASKCVECLSASTCPGTDAECHTRSCVSGQCGISNTGRRARWSRRRRRATARRTSATARAASGTVNDDLDLPVDGNACTQDVCTAGTPSNPFVTAGNSCGGEHHLRRSGRLRHLPDGVELPGHGHRVPPPHLHDGACGVSQRDRRHRAAHADGGRLQAKPVRRRRRRP